MVFIMSHCKKYFNLGRSHSINDFRQGNVCSRFVSFGSALQQLISIPQCCTTRFSSFTRSLATDAGNTLVRHLQLSTDAFCRSCMVRIPLGSSFKTFSRYGSFDKVNFFRAKGRGKMVCPIICVTRFTSNMVFT